MFHLGQRQRERGSAAEYTSRYQALKRAAGQKLQSVSRHLRQTLFFTYFINTVWSLKLMIAEPKIRFETVTICFTTFFKKHLTHTGVSSDTCLWCAAALCVYVCVRLPFSEGFSRTLAFSPPSSPLSFPFLIWAASYKEPLSTFQQPWRLPFGVTTPNPYMCVCVCVCELTSSLMDLCKRLRVSLGCRAKWHVTHPTPTKKIHLA